MRVPAVALSVALLALGCGSPGDTGRPAPRDPRDAAGAALRIFATGEMRGFLTPCGCEDRQLGGLPRRATYLSDAGRPGDLRIDLGNAASGAGALHDLRVTATLRALDDLGYAVFVPGELELLAPAVLVAAARDLRHVRVVAANLVDRDGAAPFEPFVLHELTDGRHVAVVGLVPELPAALDAWRVLPPRAALVDVLHRLVGRADAVIVATSIADDRAARTVVGVAGITLLLAPRIADAAATMTASLSTDQTDEGLRPGPPPVAVVGDFAAYVRRVDLSAALRPVRARRAWLDEDLADEPRMAAFVKDVHARAIELDPTLVPDILTGLVERGTAGSQVCAECHAAEYAAWERSGHAHAMQTLVARDSARDPGCVPCHLVDLPAADAAARGPFAAASGDDLGVGCEACHGGRREHVLSAMDGVRPPGGAPPWSARDTCRGCHHPPEVKSFDLDAAWSQIAHGPR